MSDSLSTCSYVFVRHDAVRKPLQPPYDGPYPVLSHQSKFYTLDVSGQRKTVSVDRLKPAHVDFSTSPRDHATVSPNTSTPPSDSLGTPDIVEHSHSSLQEEPSLTPPTVHSGRRVRWPRRLADYIL